MSPRERLRGWIALLALTVSQPETSWTATIVGRGEPAQPRCSTLGPLDATAARKHLDVLMPCTTRDFASPCRWRQDLRRLRGVRANLDDVDEAVRRARRAWTGSDEIPGEASDSANEQIWGRRASLETLLAVPPFPDERTTAESSRFGDLAMTVWAPLLAAERMRSL